MPVFGAAEIQPLQHSCMILFVHSCSTAQSCSPLLQAVAAQQASAAARSVLVWLEKIWQHRAGVLISVTVVQTAGVEVAREEQVSGAIAAVVVVGEWMQQQVEVLLLGTVQMPRWT